MCWKCDQTAPVCRFFDEPTWMESTRPLPRRPPGKTCPKHVQMALRAATEQEKDNKAADCQAASPASERERRLAERPESPLSTGTTPPFARFCPSWVSSHTHGFSYSDQCVRLCVQFATVHARSPHRQRQSHRPHASCSSPAHADPRDSHDPIVDFQHSSTKQVKPC